MRGPQAGLMLPALPALTELLLLLVESKRAHQPCVWSLEEPRLPSPPMLRPQRLQSPAP